MKLLLSAAVAIVVSFYLFSPPFIYSISASFSFNKNYMFLLFNGILLLLVQSSGLTSDFQVDSDCTESITANNGNREKRTAPSLDTVKKEIKVEDIEETENRLPGSAIGEEIEKGLILFEEEEEDDDERAYVAGMMSREELNKKCDDFISKMKEAIHSEMHPLIQ